jgi:predicted ATPase/predicted Ser/Thr protein kinase
MDAERWHQIEQLYLNALQRNKEERAAFLSEACTGQADLRLEVESLLAYGTKDQDFLETPALELAARDINDSIIRSLVGRSIKHYNVLSLLGAGGMGEVYLAYDTRLDRNVALKILPPDIAKNDDRMQRFAEEARAASALNHPHVATIYDLDQDESHGIHFIAMEYVDGETLAAKIGQGQLDPSETIAIGIQIADALEVAHAAGVTHRDIKPGNIIVNSRGQAKLLDFGLAKRISPSKQPDALALARPELRMGTIQYMSPEQALGHPLDHRSDLFSFGVVLYEMATGSPPFSGKTPAEIVNAIINSQPDGIRALNDKVSRGFEFLVSQCLQKKREDRYQNASELLTDLRRAESLAPPSSRTTCPNNLPLQLTRLIGRDSDCVDVVTQLFESRLVTLTGSGGVGKTRLALQVANSQMGVYPHGVWFADLAPLSDASLLPQAVASALGVQEAPGRPITETLLDYLRLKSVLLVFDNCEHLLTACVQLIDLLLKSCEDVRILATSRESLGIIGERVVRVRSLQVPEGEGPGAMDRVLKYEAVELFVERARAVKQEFSVTTQNVTAVADVCVRLDGIPLALELAASQIRVLSMEQIQRRLQDRFRLLSTGSRTARPRHQTLSAVIDWSYDLLTEPERRLFRRLSVFVGGWVLEAAETVCIDSDAGGEGAIEMGQVLGLLSGLVDKSMVLLDARDGQPRYHLLISLQEYGHRLLLQSTERDVLLRRHAQFLLKVAQEAADKLTSPDQRPWCDRLVAEMANIRAVLRWSLDEDVLLGLRLVGILFAFWRIQAAHSETQAWLAEALAREDAKGPTLERARGLSIAGFIAHDYGNNDSAFALCGEALALAENLGDTEVIAFSLGILAETQCVRGNLAAARELYERGLVVSRGLKDEYWKSTCLTYLGKTAAGLGDLAAARHLYEECLEMLRERGDKRGVAMSLANLSSVALLKRDYSTARPLVESSLAIYRELGDKSGIAYSLWSLAIIEMQEGQFDQARVFGEESLAIRRDLGGRSAIGLSLISVGRIACYQGDYVRARAAAGESMLLHRELNHKLGIAGSKDIFATLAEKGGDYVAARSLQCESLQEYWVFGMKLPIALALERLASIAQAANQYDRAVMLWAAAGTLRERFAIPLSGFMKQECTQKIEDVRRVQGSVRFTELWEQGARMDLDTVIAYAVEDS